MHHIVSLPCSCCRQAKGKDVTMEVHDDRALLALQGPAAAEVLQVRALLQAALSVFL